MLHVRKRERQKYSEACRPLLGKHTDGVAGKIIDLLAVFALLAGTATTFSVATPLMATVVGELFYIEISRTVVTIIILLLTCFVYTYSLLHGFKGISFLAKACIYLFFGLLAFVLLFGGETKYIIESGFSSFGKMVGNFVELSTFTDPQRTTSFPQNWTIYYWAYWMVWCVAAPVFHWKYFAWKNNSSDYFRRIWIWRWIDIGQFCDSWKLFYGITDIRCSRFYCAV